MIKLLKNKMKQNNGFTGLDLSISVIVILISVAVISTMIYNLYLSGSGIKRNVIATDYAINILETINATEYSKVAFNTGDDTLKNELDNLLDPNDSFESSIIDNKYIFDVNNYNISVTIEKYSDKFNTGEKEDYIKIVTVKIEYSLGKKNVDKSVNTEVLEISTLKTIN